MTTQMHALFVAIRPRPCKLQGPEAANPIYREIILRPLAHDPHDALPQIPSTWFMPDGRLHEDVLLQALLDFWRRHGDSPPATARDYALAPSMILSAFLQRVVDGGSRVREYVLGGGRVSRCVRHQGETLAIETKVWRPETTDPLQDGLRQIDGYLAGMGLNARWLAISDSRPDTSVVSERLCAALATTREGLDVTWISRMSSAWTAPPRPHGLG